MKYNSRAEGLNEIEIKQTPKQLEKSLFKRIEKFDAFEERLGVIIQNISIKIENERNWITLFYELHSTSGTTINSYITVECILYDTEGLVIGEAHTIIGPDKFFGFEVVKEEFRKDNIAEQVSKIRIYPKKF